MKFPIFPTGTAPALNLSSPPDESDSAMLYLLLMDAHRYEFLELTFDPKTALVRHLLNEVPMIATVTTLKQQEYVDICKTTGEEVGKDGQFIDFDISKENIGNSRNRQYLDKVALAIPKGKTGKEVARLAAPILHDCGVISAIFPTHHPGEKDDTIRNLGSKELSPKPRRSLSALMVRNSAKKTQSKTNEEHNEDHDLYREPITTVSQSEACSDNLPRDEISMECLHAFSSLKVKDHTRYHKTYKRCFMGRDAVDLLVSLGHAQTRAEAVQLGRTASEVYKLFEHVSGTHRFEDDILFYSFEKIRDNTKVIPTGM